MAVTPEQTEVDPSTEDAHNETPNQQPRLSYPSPPLVSPPPLPDYYRRPGVKWRLIIWSVLLTVVGIMALGYYQSIFFLVKEPVVEERSRFIVRPSPTLSATPSATPTLSPADPFTFLDATITPTPVPGGQLLVLKPATEDTGWVASGEETSDSITDAPNHFGDSFLYSGVLDGKVYYAAFQFDLSAIARGTQIYGANLRLTSLRADLLNDKNDGMWQVQLLTPEVNTVWQTLDYDQLSSAAMTATLDPIIQLQLGEGEVNDIQFTTEQLEILEQRILKGNDEFGPKISFRIDGPIVEEDNLYAWDSGYGEASRGNGPKLFLSLGPEPSVTPQPDYVIITSTPTPDNVLTAAAISFQMTATATRVGTATPLPPHWVTPWLVTATPTPENEATIQVINREATAIALTTGVPPAAANMVVVTDTPAPPTPTYVIVTSTPTPINITTAVAMSQQMTAEAVRAGTATPLPDNWVTPLIVTATPTPENRATVEYAQAIVLTTGTPTPLPDNAQTATPTPEFVLIEPILTPTPTALPTPTPESIPANLLGKIVFLSDREGPPEGELIAYVFDPETGQLGRLTALWPYDVASDREAWSADERFRVFTKDAIRHPVAEGGKSEIVPELYVYDYFYEVEWQLTKMGAGLSWNGVWSPTSNQIAFVSNESSDDEIWAVDYDGSNIRRLTDTNEAFNAREIGKDTFIPEVNYHPSWSPDGQEIVFSSNRTGNFQIWIMNKDGSNQRLLMDWNPYNDWDPIWIKSLDPAPPLVKPN